MTAIHTIFPQLSACSDDEPTGRVIEAHYTLQDELVTLVDEDGDPVRDRWGNPIRGRLVQGDDARAVASRLALKHHRDTEDDEDDFNRPISGNCWKCPY